MFNRNHDTAAPSQPSRNQPSKHPVDPVVELMGEYLFNRFQESIADNQGVPQSSSVASIASIANIQSPETSTATTEPTPISMRNRADNHRLSSNRLVTSTPASTSGQSPNPGPRPKHSSFQVILCIARATYGPRHKMLDIELDKVTLPILLQSLIRRAGDQRRLRFLPRGIGSP
jgi:hypothetical protein